MVESDRIINIHQKNTIIESGFWIKFELKATLNYRHPHLFVFQLAVINKR